ncbi:MAG: hypothetical protein AAGA66_13365 [Bacteroidota bacterium]
MKTNRILVLLYVVFASTACIQKNIRTSTIEPDNQDLVNDDWLIDVLDSYKDERFVQFTITNNSDETLTVLNPLYKYVEQEESGNWRKLSLGYCMCSYNCPNPPEEIKVAPGSTYTFSWDKKEETCDGQRSIKTEIESGTFQATLSYVKGRSVKKVIVPFNY